MPSNEPEIVTRAMLESLTRSVKESDHAPWEYDHQMREIWACNGDNPVAKIEKHVTAQYKTNPLAIIALRNNTESLIHTIELFAGLLEESCECGHKEIRNYTECESCQRKAAALRRYRGEG